MIQFIPSDYDQTGWDDRIVRFDGLSLLQKWAWGAAKAEAGVWAVERGLLQEENGRILGAAQVMIRRLPWIGGGLGWIARGPLSAPGETERYAALLSALRRHYVEDRHLYLRISPALPAGLLPDSRLEAAGFRRAGISGWASAVVDLDPPEDVLRRRLAQKWRNGLNKAERADVLVEVKAGGDDFTGFLDSYSAFVAGRGFSTSVTGDVLAALQRLLPDTGKMKWWRCTQHGEQLGSALIIRYGDRAEYLAGTLTEAGRRYNAGQILLWRALLAEKQNGARWFDLGGMDPDLTPQGVLAFKAGIGGTPYRLESEIEADDAGLRSRLVRWRVARARAAAGATL